MALAVIRYSTSVLCKVLFTSHFVLKMMSGVSYNIVLHQQSVICICMYVHTYVCLYVCLYVHTYICLYVCMSVCQWQPYQVYVRMCASLYRQCLVITVSEWWVDVFAVHWK